MRFIKIFCVLFSGTILFNSCNNKLNILAPYKEAVSVYAALNPQEKNQFVRINKIFLGEGNAYDMAQNHDSVNYKAGELTVTLERFVNGSPAVTTVGNSKTQIVLRDTLTTLEPGLFNQQQRLYYTTDKLFTYGDYQLTIKNNTTGNIFKSKTVIIDSAKYFNSLVQPLGGPYYPVPYDPVNDKDWFYVDYSLPSTKTKPAKVNFLSTSSGREYSGIIRFHYMNYVGAGPNYDSIPGFADFKLTTISSSNLNGGEQLQFDFDAADFINAISNVITKQGDPASFYARRPVKLQYIITAASQDLVDFLYISAPSTSVAQDKPVYTNIDGGFGIFGSRSRFTVVKQLHTNFINYIANNKPTCNLRFLNTIGQVPTSCN
jgi:hypothetical protein